MSVTFRAEHYKNLTETANRARKVSGAQGRRVGKRVRNYSVGMRIQCRIISVKRLWHVLEKNMNCKLKLHSKGFYQQILGAVTALKFLQKRTLDFPYICVQFFPGNFYRQMYRSFSLSRNKKINCKPSSGRSQENDML